MLYQLGYEASPEAGQVRVQFVPVIWRWHDMLKIVWVNCTGRSPSQWEGVSSYFTHQIYLYQRSGHHGSFFLSLFQTCDENRRMLSSSLKCLVLCYHVCTLHTTVIHFFKEHSSQLQEASKSAIVPESPDVTAPPAYDGVGFPPNLLNEWEDFFSATVYGTLLSVFLHFAGKILVTQKRESWQTTLFCSKILLFTKKACWW